jgi:hypothetical protein
MEFIGNGAALGNKFKGGYEKIDKEKVFSAIEKK